MATLARGGRLNIFGFGLRLIARIPFLFIAGRIYGPEQLGRFAYAVLVVEFGAQVAA
ncbi:MAG: lipopolysaccharide biosynthesis protein, partial [Sphingomonas sp.]|nr:lipopolysaccharide biosynthesis protein [Sphingomonas sp.]